MAKQKSSTLAIHFSKVITMDSKVLKPIYMTEKMGTDPSKKEYGPHIFARVINRYHVFGDG